MRGVARILLIDDEARGYERWIVHDWLEHLLIWQVDDWLAAPPTDAPPGLVLTREWGERAVRILGDWRIRTRPDVLIELSTLRELSPELRQRITQKMEQGDGVRLQLDRAFALAEQRVNALIDAADAAVKHWPSPAKRASALDAVFARAIELRASIRQVPAGVLLP